MKLNKRNQYPYSYNQKKAVDSSNLGILKLMFLMIGERAYEYLQPVIERVQQVNPRVRALVLVVVSSFVVLLLSMWFFSMIFNMGNEESTSPSVPSAQQVFAAPYDIDQRQLPVDGTDPNAFLPQTIGESYAFVTTSLPIDSGTQKVNPNAVGALHMCMVDFDNSCTMQYTPQYYTLGRYADVNQEVVQVFVGNYWTPETAHITVTELITRSRTVGYVGNFVSGGLGTIDYFYSTSNGWYSFTWTRGAWVISVSGRSREALETAIQTLSI
ncbi:MAG: hypothetical protein DPW16_09660 [Chloroflexi bacterium]|nr:hypothetical protein [Chloroflexota bacterium]